MNQSLHSTSCAFRQSITGSCRRWRVAVSMVLLVLMSVLCCGCGSTPQLLDDDAVASELDAFFTAVTSKKPELLKASRERFTKLHAEQRLSPEGFERLSGIADQAESGKWEPAARELYDLIRAQRRKKKD